MTKRAHLRPWRRPGAAALLASVLAISGFWAGPLASAAAADKGPLDPLTAAEIQKTLQVIEASNKYPAGAFFPIVTLKEPPKSELLAWDPGEPFRREAFANVYERGANRLFEAVVDLKTQKLTSWVERPGVQPAVSISEYADRRRHRSRGPSLAQGDPRPEHQARRRLHRRVGPRFGRAAPGHGGEAADAGPVVLRRRPPEPVRSPDRGRGRDRRHERHDGHRRHRHGHQAREHDPLWQL